MFKEDIFPFKSLQSFPDHLFLVLDLQDSSYTESFESESDKTFIPGLNPTTSIQPQTSSNITAPLVPLRRSSRQSKPPIWMDSYVTESAQSACLYPMSQYVTYSKLAPTYRASLAAYSLIPEPHTYKEACQDTHWVNSIRDEINALENNNTWSIVPLPSTKVPIGCKWVFKVKYKASGEVERYKARLIAKGYNQKEGLDGYSKVSSGFSCFMWLVYIPNGCSQCISSR